MFWIYLILPTFGWAWAAGWVPSGDPETRPGDLGDGCEDESPRGAAPGLPAPHSGPQGIALCERRTL